MALQRVVDAFPWKSMKMLAENAEAVSHLRQLIAAIEFKDVYGAPLRNLPPKAVFHRAIADNGALNIALFELGPGSVIPTHTHPGIVFSKVLAGSLQAVTFTRSRSLGGLTVTCERNAILRPGDVHFTGAHKENIHTFRTVEENGGPVVILDFLAPAYSEDRPATYFNVRPRAELLQSRLPSSAVLPKQFQTASLPWSATPGTEYSVSVLPDGPTDFETFDRPYTGPAVSLPSVSSAASVSAVAALGASTSNGGKLEQASLA